MEEFRRRKNLKDYYSMMNAHDRKSGTKMKQPEVSPFDMNPEAQRNHEMFHGAGEERFFEPKRDEIFDP